MEQELHTHPEHLSSPQDFSVVHVTRSLVICVWFVDRCLYLCPLSVGHCVVCPSINGFGLPLWYLQTIITNNFNMTSFIGYLYNTVNRTCILSNKLLTAFLSVVHTLVDECCWEESYTTKGFSVACFMDHCLSFFLVFSTILWFITSGYRFNIFIPFWSIAMQILNIPMLIENIKMVLEVRIRLSELIRYFLKACGYYLQALENCQ